jgi:hypothetical protein
VAAAEIRASCASLIEQEIYEYFCFFFSPPVAASALATGSQAGLRDWLAAALAGFDR